MVDVKFGINEVESNPHLVQIVAPNEIVVVIGFEIKMGGRAGTMSLCIPFNVIEPVMDKLVTQGWLGVSAAGTAAESRSEELSRGIAATTVTLDAYLAETTISVRDLLTLQPGDIIQTAKPVDGGGHYPGGGREQVRRAPRPPQGPLSRQDLPPPRKWKNPFE